MRSKYVPDFLLNKVYRKLVSPHREGREIKPEMSGHTEFHREQILNSRTNRHCGSQDEDHRLLNIYAKISTGLIPKFQNSTRILS